MSALQQYLRTTDAKERLRGLEMFVDTAGTVGIDVPKLMPELLAAIKVAQDLRGASVGQEHNLGALRERLAGELLEGRITVDDALDQITESDRLNARGSAGRVFLEQVAKAAAVRAWYAFANRGTGLLTDILRPAHARIIQQVRELGPQLVTVKDDRDAIRQRLADKWQDLNDAYEKWLALHDIADAIRFAGLDGSAAGIKGARANDFEPRELRFTEYEIARGIRTQDYPVGGMWLFHALEGVPAVLTLKQGVDNVARDERRAAAAKLVGTEPRVSTIAQYSAPDEQLADALAETERRHPDPAPR